MNSYMVAVVFVMMVLAPALVGTRNTRDEQPRRRRTRSNGELESVVSTRLLNRGGGSAPAPPRVIVVPHAVPAALRMQMPVAAHVAAAPPAPSFSPEFTMPAARPYLPQHVRPANRTVRLPQVSQEVAVVPTASATAPHVPAMPPARPATAPSARPVAAPPAPFPAARVQEFRPRDLRYPSVVEAVRPSAPPATSASHVRPWREVSYAEPSPMAYLSGNPRRNDSAPEPEQQVRRAEAAPQPEQRYDYSEQDENPEDRQPMRASAQHQPPPRPDSQRPESQRHGRPRVRYMEGRPAERQYPVYAQPEPPPQSAPQTYLVHAPMHYAPTPMAYPPPMYGYGYPQGQFQPQPFGYGHQPAYMPAPPPQPVMAYPQPYGYPQAAPQPMPMEYAYAAMPFRPNTPQGWTPVDANGMPHVYRG